MRLKHWQVFILLFVAQILSNFTWMNDGLITQLLNSSGILIYFFWNLALGLSLSDLAPNHLARKKSLFTINGSILIVSLIIVQMFYEGKFESNGFLGFLWAGYILFALFQFFSFPSKILKSIELNEDAKFTQYLWYFVLMIFWPIGIWEVQPRINNLRFSESDQSSN